MTQHTPEPWIHAPQGMIVSMSNAAQPGREKVAELRPDDARRIVACVNACRGLPTDELEQSGLASAFGNQMLELERQRDGLQAQVNELLEELTITLGSLKEICSVRQIPRPESTIRRAESAINKITGETK